MAIKEVQLKLKASVDNRDANVALTKQGKILQDQDKTLRLVEKTQSKVIKDGKKGFEELGRVAEGTGRKFSGIFKQARSELDQFSRGVSTLREKFIGLREVVEASLVGGLAIEGVKKLLEAGSATAKARGRVRREFGPEAAGIESLAAKTARAAGLRDEDALRALTLIGETTQETQAGSVLRGRRLNAAQAAAVRAQTTQFGAGLLSRIATVTGENPVEIAQLLAEAGAGPEGTRRFAGALGLNRVFARQLSEANSKGQGLAFLRAHGQAAFAGELQKQGVRGQLGQGSVLEAILRQSGVTEEAADAKRRSFGFQKQAIGALVENTLGDIGEQALNKLTGGLGKGATLAERLQKALESEKGKKAIEAISTGVQKFVDGLIKAVEALPKIFKTIEDHKTALGIIAGGFVGIKAVTGASKLVGGAKEVLENFGIGKAKELLGGAGAGAKPIPVYVVNAPEIVGGGIGEKAAGAKGLLAKAGLVVGAATAGYAVGKFIDQKTGASGKVADALRNLTGRQQADADREYAGVQGNRRSLADREARRQAIIKQLESVGVTHGQAVYLSEHPGDSVQTQRTGNGGTTTLNIALNLDGQIVTRAVVPHLEREIRKHSANGGAPTGRAE